MASELPRKFAIVGAGPLGLIVARALKRRGIDFDMIERFGKIGGIWDIDNPGSPMYESCNFITSRDNGGFIGFDMPREYPDYPTWFQVRDYVRDFARAYGLDQHVMFDREVVKAEPQGQGDDTWWRVELNDGQVLDYRGVVYAGGTQWAPFMPTFSGQDSFAGTIIHSSQYTRRAEFAGKKVVVVGAGNSGVDIVCDAVTHGEAAYLSMRRGYWFFPKQVFGTPTADLLAGYADPPKGSFFATELDQEALGDLVLAVVGDLTRYGLPAPDHPVTATHPIVNSLVIHYISNGWLKPKPDIERLEVDEVVFTDGSRVTADIIVCATGYNIDIPWLDPNLIEWTSPGHPKLHLGTFGTKARNFYATGVLHFADNGYSTFDRVSQLIAADADAVLNGINAENLRRVREEYHPDLKAGFPFVDTPRNELQVHVPALRECLETLEREYDIPLPGVKDYEFYEQVLLQNV